MRALLAVLLCCLSLTARATTLPRVLAVDIGAGVPVVAAGEITVLFAQHWQIGFGYGFVPGSTPLSNFRLPDQSFTLTTAPTTFTVSPQLSTSLDMLTPFLRFFPSDRNYYIQVAYSMLRMRMNFTSTIRDSLTNTSIGGAINGNINVTQPVPTISLGHIFASKEFFFNLSLGVSFLMNPSVGVALSGTIPDALGGTTANQTAIDTLQTQLQTAVGDAVSRVRQELVLIPSLMISAGLFL